jgi:predicted nucleic acid-binding protein
MAKYQGRVPTIYLETSVFNFPFADDAPQYKADTLRLFEELQAGKFKPVTSRYVVDELAGTKDTEKREKMSALIFDYNIEILEPAGEIVRLAELYVSEGIVPKKFRTDALHIAAATVHGVDYIISLNFRHIVKHKTIFETEVVNMREGYKRVFIHTPAEVIDNG